VKKKLVSNVRVTETLKQRIEKETIATTATVNTCPNQRLSSNLTQQPETLRFSNCPFQYLTVKMRPHNQPGPKKATVDDRVATGRVLKVAQHILDRGLDKEVERRFSYNNKNRIVIMRLKRTAWIPVPEYGYTTKRRPTWMEIEKYTGVPKNTASKWPAREENILQGRTLDRKNCVKDRSHWPGLEEALFQAFCERRAKGETVRRDWFRWKSTTLFAEMYPDYPVTAFKFSKGWFAKFLARQSISLRVITNKAQKLPQEYLQDILSFFRFNRRNSQLRPGDEPQAVGRYKERRIINMDQTPSPFEYLDGQTYEHIGAKTVQAKSTKSGWDKRQATLMISASGDGQLLKIIIIFRGEGLIPHEELAQLYSYSDKVIVLFNENAYCNEEVMQQWFDGLLIPYLEEDGDTGPTLGILDAAAFHKTPALLEHYRSYDVTPSIVPSGCTGLVQPADVVINKPFKAVLRSKMERELDRLNYEASPPTTASAGLSAIGQRRLLLVKAVAETWEEFQTPQRKEMIASCFRR
jgi:hypothetical protein